MTTEAANPAPSLLDVRKAIPERCYENPTWKGLAYAARAFAIYGAVVAALVVVHAWWLLVPLWILAGLAVSGLFVLGHDASHGALFRSRTLNRVLGRLAMLPAAHIEPAWDLGHNRIHHGHTVQQGIDFVWHPLTPDEWDALPAWKRARHRFEWSALGAGFYYLREVWWNKMITFRAPRKWAGGIRRGRVQLLAALAVGAVFLGFVGWLRQETAFAAIWTWVKAGVIPWLLFTWMIGITVYVHHVAEDIRWYPRAAWTQFRGQVEGTTLLRTPRPFNVFAHHIFVHVPHHVDQRIPFYELPAAAAAIAAAFPGSIREAPLSLRRYLRTTRRCKLYDFERGVWVRFPRHTAST